MTVTFEVKVSHLLQMRGLKHVLFAVNVKLMRRIFYRCVDWNLLLVLKLLVILCRIFYRCVDWNLYVPCGRTTWIVASFTDAWIETARPKVWWCPAYVASFTDAWIETLPSSSTGVEDVVASFTDAWIETQASVQGDPGHRCRIFYRCVDWNFGFLF